MAGRLAIAAVMALQALLIPRLLGPQSMGVYAYWVSIFLVLQAAFELGTLSVLARYLPEYWMARPGAVRSLFRLMLGVKFPVILAVLGAGVFLTPDPPLHFAAVAAAAGITAVGIAYARVLYARGRMAQYALYPLVRVGTRLLLILALFPLLGDGGTVLAFLAGSILTALVFGPLAERLMPGQSAPLPQPMRFYLAFGLWTYLGGLAAMFTRWGPVLLCRHIGVPFAALGMLGLGIQLMLFARNLLACVADGTLPTLVALRLTEPDRFSRALAACWRYTNILLFPLAAAFCTLARPAIVRLIGPEFAQSGDILRGLVPAIVFFAWAHPHGHVFLVHERKPPLLLTNLIGLVVFAVVGGLLVPAAGIHGAVLALNAGTLAAYVYALVVTHRLQPVPGYGLAVLRPAACALIMATVMHAIQAPRLVPLALAATAGLAVYIGLMLVVGGISAQDLRRLVELLKRAA